jgi:hypothetical protein
MTDNLNAALALAEDGWHVFPLRPGTKIPLIPKSQGGNGCLDGTTDPDQITKWWTATPNAGIGANLGDDRLAIDIDIQNGGEDRDEFPITRTHLSGRGNGNKHLIYKFAPGSAASKLRPKNAALGRGIDLKIGRGAYIVMPPTPHEQTGNPYTITDVNQGLEHWITDAEIHRIFTPQPTKTITSPQRPTNQLAQLLSDPPQEGGRNEWLTHVAGYYAKQYRKDEPAYRVAVRLANDMLTTPLPTDEMEKTSNSIWEAEQRNHPERNAELHNGYLVADGPNLLCQVIVREGDQQIPALGHFADFDIKAVGVAIDHLDQRTYWVELHTAEKIIQTTIMGETFGDDRAIRRWLAALGLSVDPPMNAIPRTNIGVRLLRYLNSQNPPKVKIVDQLGWNTEIEAFVTHDGIITQNGPTPKSQAGIVANPSLLERDVAPYHYGFEHTWETAQTVLREVLTYQDPTVTAVFSSWWAACLLKPQLQNHTSLFPFFGVEAVSESGKTNGFFDLMVQLNGNTRGEIAPTRPVLRDYSSANRSGIVWADDLDSLEPYGELLRASTSNGVAAKMDVDRSAVRNTQIVAPLLVTGETLGMGTQKALIDRSVIINVPSPKGRQSTRGDWAQWEDILNLTAQFPKEKHGLSSLAGWYIQKALQYSDDVVKYLKEAKKKGQGRHGDKLAVLRAGAYLIERFLDLENPGEGHITAQLEIWITEQAANGWLDKDNTLTTTVLPWALRTWGYPETPTSHHDIARFAGIDTPAFVKDNEIWVSIPLIAQAWARDRNHRIEQRTESEQALKQQAEALVAGGKTWHIAGSNHKGWYRKIPTEYAEAVINRAQGTTKNNEKITTE